MRDGLASFILWQRALRVAVRAFAAVLTVAIAEELAFCGFLMRWLVNRDFAKVQFQSRSILYLLGSSVAFGAMHVSHVVAATLARLGAMVLHCGAAAASGMPQPRIS